MKYSTQARMFGMVYGSLVKNEITNKKVLSAIKKEYRAIMGRASDIGSHNNLFSSYTLCAYFIAMNRVTKLSPQANCKILERQMEKSKLLKSFLGSKEQYCSEKKMEFRRKWSAETHEKKYENDWVVDIVPGNGQYLFGFDYWECGVCKLCRDEGCPELAKYLCRLDYMLISLVGLKLERTGTLADGAPKCDFRFIDPAQTK